jgi:hypothetical protein
MRRVTIIYLFLAGFLLAGCQVLEKKQQSGAAVEVNGHYLYRSTLDELTVGLSSEDSMRVVQQYISQWAKDILIYDAVNTGKSNLAGNEIERMVEDYRRALYIHAYEEYLVENNMSKTVLDSTVQQMYDQMIDRFKLDESIVHGLLVVVPNNAPNIAKLRRWLNSLQNQNGEINAESLDNIEKYAYQMANGYELFTDKWLTTTDIASRVPVEHKELETRLKNKNQIEATDSLNTYIVQITDKHLRGEYMPLEFARPEIEKIILGERQVDFLQKERERLYNEAIQEGKIKFY